MDRFVLSNEEVNEYGFWILMSGVDIKHFIANPIMLFEHESYNEKDRKGTLPIGKWTDINIKNGVLTAIPEFDENDSFAKEVKNKVENGYLSATSVGFRPYEFSDAPKFLKKGQTRAAVTKSRIKEASFVKFPGNLSAIRLYDENDQLIQLSDEGKGLDAFFPLLHDQNFELNMKKIAMQFGLPEDASEEQIIKAINQLQDERIEMLLNHGKERGTLNDKNIDQYRKLAQSDFETTKELILSETPPAKPTEKKEEKQDDKKVTTELSVAELFTQLSQNGGGSQLNDRSNWTYNDWEEKDPKGLQELQLSDPEKFEKLAATYKGRKYQ